MENNKKGDKMSKELIANDIILFDLEAETKQEIIEKLADAMDKDGRLEDKDGYMADVLAREESSSTAIGFETATPHAKSISVKEPSLAFARLKHPIKWDDEEVSMIFQISVPSPGQGDRHLEILSKLFRNLVYDSFRDQMLQATTKEEIVDILKEF